MSEQNDLTRRQDAISEKIMGFEAKSRPVNNDNWQWQLKNVVKDIATVERLL